METFADSVMEKIKQLDPMYYRLVILVAPTGGGKTSALKEVRNRTGAPLINVNLELSRGMLSLTERQQRLQLSKLLSDIVFAFSTDLVLLDNTEMLFDTALKQNPMQLLKRLSRNRRVVVAWNGYVESGNLIYAKPDHPEYGSFPVKDFLIVSAETSI